MKKILRIASVLMLASCIASSAFAVKSPESPRILGHGMQIVKAPSDVRVAPILSGNPAGLAMFGTWVTSDWEADPWTTNTLWYDEENLVVYWCFMTTKAPNVGASILVKNQSGAEVYRNSGEFEITTNEVWNIYDEGIGMLPPGNYKIIVKIRQGTRVVGNTYWIQTITTPPDALQQR